ncbi:hypothetical protein Abr02nite_78360 [Paractinoplanes brasiliensis]|nr:hypothetical protein Abr02nite_78360 [Actinoplanes brasiliensis]
MATLIWLQALKAATRRLLRELVKNKFFTFEEVVAPAFPGEQFDGYGRTVRSLHQTQLAKSEEGGKSESQK